MPINGTSTDYSTRTKDIHIFQGVDVSKVSNITPSFGKISNYCTGIQKLVQRYAISLLSELGSQPGFTDFGTNLVSTLLRSSSRMSKADVFTIFNFANLKVIKLFKNYQQKTADLPLDEQLATAKLIDINVVNGNVSLSIQLYPLTGEPVKFVVPLPTNK